MLINVMSVSLSICPLDIHINLRIHGPLTGVNILTIPHSKAFNIHEDLMNISKKRVGKATKERNKQ